MSADYDVVASVVDPCEAGVGRVTDDCDELETRDLPPGERRGPAALTGARTSSGRHARQLVDVDEVAREDPLSVLRCRWRRNRDGRGAARRQRTAGRAAVRAADADLEAAQRWSRRRSDAFNRIRCDESDVARKWRAEGLALIELGGRPRRHDRLAAGGGRLAARPCPMEQTGGATPGRLRRAEDVLARSGLRRLGGGRLRSRDQLRGLLEAYRAKADSLGLAEDPKLEAQFTTSATAALYVAPCDVEAAQRAVQAYRMRRAGRAGREAGADRDRCERPGCDGEIIDGYCDDCGHRAPDLVAAPRSAAFRRVRGASVPAGVLYGHDRRRRLLRRVRIGTAPCRVPARPVVSATSAVAAGDRRPRRQRSPPSSRGNAHP